MILLNKVKVFKLHQKNIALWPEIYYFNNTKDIISFLLTENSINPNMLKSKLLKYLSKTKKQKLNSINTYLKYQQNNLY